MNLNNIFFNNKILYPNDQIVLGQDTTSYTGTLSASYSQTFYVGGVPFTGIIYSGTTATISAMANNLKHDDPDFDTSWVSLTGLSAAANPRIVKIIDSTRYVCFFVGAGNNIGSDFKASMFTADCGNFTA